MHSVKNGSSTTLQIISPPEGCQHYADLSEMPWDIQKSSLLFIRRDPPSLTSLGISTKDTAYSLNTIRVYG